jgi:mannose-6-phosphate isomerase-like protein (cupin superfamily)
MASLCAAACPKHLECSVNLGKDPIMNRNFITSRRKFVKVAWLCTIFTIFEFRFHEALAKPSDNRGSGLILHEEEGEQYLLRRGSTVTIKVSKEKNGIDSLSFCWEDIIPGDEVPVHKHLKEDELIYIQSGVGVFTLGERESEVKAGSTAFVPKGIWHGLKNTGTASIRMIFTYHPSGFEGFFREVGHSKGSVPKKFSEDEILALGKKYNMVFKDITKRVKMQ